MGRKEKLRERLKTVPADFTWKELCSLLNGFGYEVLKGAGSRRKFVKDGRVIILHEPHPGRIVKKYVLKQVLAHLRENGELK